MMIGSRGGVECIVAQPVLHVKKFLKFTEVRDAKGVFCKIPIDKAPSALYTGHALLAQYLTSGHSASTYATTKGSDKNNRNLSGQVISNAVIAAQLQEDSECLHP